MHLLAARPGRAEEGEAVDLGQTPAEVVVLSAADSELASLAAAQRALAALPAGRDVPTLRLANLMQLGHHASVDLYVDGVLRHAKLIVVRVLGGRGYWPYGVDELATLARAEGIALALLPGDDKPDPELARLSTLPTSALDRLWRYLVHGGPANAAQFLRYGAHLIGRTADWREPEPLLRAGYYWPGDAAPDLDAVRAGWRAGAPVALLVFYRALVQAADTAPVDALIAAMQARGLNPLPLHVASLKDPQAAALLAAACAAAPPAVIVNATGFAGAATGGERAFAGLDCPVLQVAFAGSDEAAWREGTRGLGPRDIAMNVALPEVDGRLFTRAVSFKAARTRDPLTECAVSMHAPKADRVAWVADLAAAWARLRATPPARRRIALVLANYPSRDGRIGNGVGLDTPASTVAILRALAAAGYAVADIPPDGNALIARLAEGPTNARRSGREVREELSFAEYQLTLARLSPAARRTVDSRWGAPEADPGFRPGRLGCGAFAIAALRFGNVAVIVQPSRGYDLDPKAAYHDPDLPPPHGYLAAYAWINEAFRADAIVHVGKHGNLEWLPGKALALSADCFPEAAMAPLPHLYPFIVNDPGEGTQAKRRAAAAIVDHLTPPLTRAGSYGPLAELERMIDEYYEAAGMDPRRLRGLADDILALCRASGLDRDAGLDVLAGDAALVKLDGYLCELKEMQIRDGLHIFGASPAGDLRDGLLVALLRCPRGSAPGDASIIRALADDLGLGVDPLAVPLGEPWAGPRPSALAQAGDGPWRTAGDTVERLEALALDLVKDARAAAPEWGRTRPVLETLDARLRPAVERSGGCEMAALLAGLDGRFIEPGPSGAPTRGRPDVLPTGRNFFSLDPRSVPTPAAWALGWKSAGLIVERYVQDHGDWPQALALSAWGTSAMRTGGDDIAQALALLGVRPTWEVGSRRVTGFEVLPSSVLGRPRVDVMLRVSGFFRDAFPDLIALMDRAVAAVAALDEPPADNPLAARVREESARLTAAGVAPAQARRQASFRVFGSKPGAYGAGLQALIDGGQWEDEADLARAYVAWGGYAYGADTAGEAAPKLFERRLARVQLVLQNQDNREHDLLDSDDYYQFEGGLAAAVRVAAGAAPAVYHGDHARPEQPVIRTLEDEIARVVRARCANPRWIKGCMRHGYKGGFEMAATVDYLFAFAATARCVADHHFDAVFEAYLGDAEVRGFLEANNPAALREMAARLLEAERRGLWRSRLNHAHTALVGLAAGSPKEEP